MSNAVTRAEAALKKLKKGTITLDELPGLMLPGSDERGDVWECVFAEIPKAWVVLRLENTTRAAKKAFSLYSSSPSEDMLEMAGHLAGMAVFHLSSQSLEGYSAAIRRRYLPIYSELRPKVLRIWLDTFAGANLAAGLRAATSFHAKYSPKEAKELLDLLGESEQSS